MTGMCILHQRITRKAVNLANCFPVYPDREQN